MLLFTHIILNAYYQKSILLPACSGTIIGRHRDRLNIVNAQKRPIL